MTSLVSITILMAVATSTTAFTPKIQPLSPLRGNAKQVMSSLSLPVVDIFNSGDASNAVMNMFEKKQDVTQKRQEAVVHQRASVVPVDKLRIRKVKYLAGQELADTSMSGSFSETALRSVVKAFCWRIIAGLVTFTTTLQFSGSVVHALQVVGADFFSKSFTMFIGERLMNNSQVGRQKGGDNAGRSLAKALIWRVFAVSNTLTMAIFISKDLSIASKIASTDAVFKTALMFFYERMWANIAWGTEFLTKFESVERTSTMWCPSI